MRREVLNPDGSKDIYYANGNLKKISADIMVIRRYIILNVIKSSHFIATAEELKAFVKYLATNQDKYDLFKIYLQQKLYKCSDMEKLIRDLIADELFLEYNYAGILGKKSLHNMVLFETLLYRLCYNGENQDEYIGEVKRIINRARDMTSFPVSIRCCFRTKRRR